MRKEVFGVLLFIFLISLSSAYYKCADNSTFDQSLGEINEGEKKTINGLGIGLTNADEVSVISRLAANLLINCDSVILTDETPSGIIKIMDGTEYNITLLNSTEELTKIKVGSSSGELEGEDIVTIGGFEVFLVSREGAYPANSEVSLLLGKSQLSLATDNVKEKVVEVDSVEYLIGIYSASDQDATISVEKCDNQSVKIIEIADEPDPEINDTNETITNQTNETLNNNTINNDLNNTVNNETLGENNSVNDTGANQQNPPAQESKTFDFVRKFAIYGLGALILIVLILVAKRIKDRSKIEEKLAS